MMLGIFLESWRKTYEAFMQKKNRVEEKIVTLLACQGWGKKYNIIRTYTSPRSRCSVYAKLFFFSSSSHHLLVHLH